MRFQRIRVTSCLAIMVLLGAGPGGAAQNPKPPKDPGARIPV
jgi:hypothetical protein